MLFFIFLKFSFVNSPNSSPSISIKKIQLLDGLFVWKYFLQFAFTISIFFYFNCYYKLSSIRWKVPRDDLANVLIKNIWGVATHWLVACSFLKSGKNLLTVWAEGGEVIQDTTTSVKKQAMVMTATGMMPSVLSNQCENNRYSPPYPDCLNKKAQTTTVTETAVITAEPVARFQYTAA